MMLPPSLRKLARSYGVQTSYRDVGNKLVETDPEVLVVILRALGAGAIRVEDASDALRERRLRSCQRSLPPVTTIWDGGTDGVRMILPVGELSRSLSATLSLDGGDTRDWSPSARTILRKRSIEGRDYLVVRFPLPSLPNGYHRLTVRTASIEASSLIIRAPVRAFRESPPRKRWGLFAPVYGLHSRESNGVGNFTDLRRLMELTEEHRGDFVSTLPLLASYPDEPSPYSPVSRLFWNELYVDPRRSPEWDESHVHETPNAPPEHPRLLDYPALQEAKRRVLSRLADKARRLRPEAVDVYKQRFPLALDYARFRALDDIRGTHWDRWSGKSAQGHIEDTEVGEPDVFYHLYVQSLAEEQLEALSTHPVELYLDSPLGVHPLGYDTWRERGLFAHAVDVGAPPDEAFAEGQNWSFPPVLPDESRHQGHRYLRRAFGHAMRHANVLRIDHVMGLHRQFWIPKGADVAQGTYVHYPADELYAVLSLESHRAGCELVGENLGIVPEIVNERLLRHGLYGLYVRELTPESPIPEDAVACLNTHDVVPYASSGNVGLDDLKRALKTLLESRAALVSVSLEDLWLETERQNVPGTTAEHPNWRRPLRYSLDELEDRVGNILDTFRR